MRDYDGAGEWAGEWEVIGGISDWGMSFEVVIMRRKLEM